MCYILYIITMQKMCNLIGWNSKHMFDIFNYYRANADEMWNVRKLGGITFEPQTFMCRNRINQNQHLIVLKLDIVSINKILVTEFITVKVSQKLNVM